LPQHLPPVEQQALPALLATVPQQSLASLQQAAPALQQAWAPLQQDFAWAQQSLPLAQQPSLSFAVQQARLLGAAGEFLGTAVLCRRFGFCAGEAGEEESSCQGHTSEHFCQHGILRK